ncbi:MAG: hypothetical protein AEth_01127 [Candidatus Argoarchaeum ethanivorans]|uniref:Major facilitator superfamily (MFS) profile domain-containing protein n=1 Tax=Candidatus Argoarchaeum ethanivorans TaxID=2608793 RepID=A0A811TGZ9_9EURY|nr:MAG: hypothetical protein AEth_01127 [Candidatus Argoarchaeum ethanivorans]CAD6493777.1 MAG: hypothetical protein DIAAKJNI_00551 [Candidatus Argoarchaeum ethanivorans]
MIALFLEILIATVVSIMIYSWYWWAPAISFPLIMSIGNQMYEPPILLSNYRRIVDGLLTLSQIGYVISQIIIFHINIGSWYGWLIGGIVGLILMGFMIPRRWWYES